MIALEQAIGQQESVRELPPAHFKIACVIPAYNEERFIEGVIQSVPDYVDHIIVVNDASTDKTASVVESLRDPRVVLVNHDINRGVGGAMVTGYRKARELESDVAIKLDGDGQMDPRNMRRLITPILRGQADYAKGVRFRESDVVYNMPLVRLVGNLGLSFLTKLASGYWDVFDPTNGYTALGRAGLERLRFERLSRGYFFETSMLIYLYRIDAVVTDIPMKARYGNEKSKLSPTKAFFSFPMYLLGALIKRIIWRYFIRDFTACSAFIVSGGLLFLFGLTFGLYHWMLSATHHLPTMTGTVMIAAVPLILGFQLILQAIVLDTQNVPTKPLSRLLDEIDRLDTN